MGIWLLFAAWYQDDPATILAKIDKRLADAKSVRIQFDIYDGTTAGSHGGTTQAARATLLIKGKKLNLSIQGTMT